MVLIKIKSTVLSTAVKELPILKFYLSDFPQENECFITRANRHHGSNLQATVDDYVCNEAESIKFKEIAQRIMGDVKIDLKVISVVEL